MNIPGGIDVPGRRARLPRARPRARPDTLVVVNCAGRTRSIIGCQSLRNAGIPNKVVALKDGTMGWDLAGFECERGAVAHARRAFRARQEEGAGSAPSRSRSASGSSSSHARRSKLASDATAPSICSTCARARSSRPATSPARATRPAASWCRPADEYVGVRNARVVLIDPERVRAVMTASWLNQMGWHDVYVLDEHAGFDVEIRRRASRRPAVQAVADR